jgi:hypothetical protein
MRNREQWRLVAEEAKAHPGCSAEEEEEEWNASNQPPVFCWYFSHNL